MDQTRRRDAVRAYKERAVHPGIFRITCTVTGESWVAGAAAVDTTRNSVWFALRLGSHPNKALQAAWRTHGEAAFEHAVLERNAEGLSALGRDLWLKGRTAHWRTQLGARPLWG
jgi:hypothetical protein